MKKTITAFALAAFGVSAFAQSVEPAAENDFVIGAKFDFESRYVTDGKRHVNENTQTTISLKYFVPSSSDVSFTPYANFFWMSPTDNYRKDVPLSNEGSVTVGSEVAIGETFGLDFGYKFTGWNDTESAWVMNRAAVNHTNEIFFGVNKTISLIDGNEDGDIKGTAHIRYNWDLRQVAYEIGIAKTFSLDEIGLSFAAVYGYLDANRTHTPYFLGGGENPVPVIDKKGHNDYGYFAVSADVSYRINSGTDVGLGVRYAYNNDGDEGLAGKDNNNDNLWWGAWINFRY